MGKDHSKKANKGFDELDPQERELFLNAFFQGEGYDSSEDKKPSPQPSQIKRAKIEEHEIEEDDRELFLNAFNQGVIGPKVTGERLNPKRLAQARLKKASHVDCTIDLHGMYAKDAAAALLGFIRQEKARGSKTMLVIHGKGAGVLKKTVWSIIKTHPDIDDFQQASWRHGGAGAIIVRLHRRTARLGT